MSDKKEKSLVVKVIIGAVIALPVIALVVFSLNRITSSYKYSQSRQVAQQQVESVTSQAPQKTSEKIEFTLNPGDSKKIETNGRNLYTESYRIGHEGENVFLAKYHMKNGEVYKWRGRDGRIYEWLNLVGRGNLQPQHLPDARGTLAIEYKVPSHGSTQGVESRFN